MPSVASAPVPPHSLPARLKVPLWLPPWCVQELLLGKLYAGLVSISRPTNYSFHVPRQGLLSLEVDLEL